MHYLICKFGAKKIFYALESIQGQTDAENIISSLYNGKLFNIRLKEGFPSYFEMEFSYNPSKNTVSNSIVYGYKISKKLKHEYDYIKYFLYIMDYNCIKKLMPLVKNEEEIYQLLSKLQEISKKPLKDIINIINTDKHEDIYLYYKAISLKSTKQSYKYLYNEVERLYKINSPEYGSRLYVILKYLMIYPEYDSNVMPFCFQILESNNPSVAYEDILASLVFYKDIFIGRATEEYEYMNNYLDKFKSRFTYYKAWGKFPRKE